MTTGFRRRGNYVMVTMSDVEVQSLRVMARDLVYLLGSDPDEVRQTVSDPLTEPVVQLLPTGDPVLGRLFPDGYIDDVEAAQELRSMIEPTLRENKLDAIWQVLTKLPAESGPVWLSEESATQWLTVINDIRLALGTRMDISAESDIDEDVQSAIAENDQFRSSALSIYMWLSYLLESLIDALDDSLSVVDE